MSLLGGIGKIIGAPFNSLGNITGLHINPFNPRSWSLRRPNPTLMDFINVASLAGGPSFMQNLMKGNFAKAFGSLNLNHVGLKNFLGAAGIKDPSKMQPGDWMRLVSNLQKASAQPGSAGGQTASSEFGGNGGAGQFANGGGASGGPNVPNSTDPTSPAFDWSKGDWGDADWSKETTRPNPLDPNYNAQYGGSIANLLFPTLQSQINFAGQLEPQRQNAVQRASDYLDPGFLQQAVDQFKANATTQAVETGKQQALALGPGSGLAEGAKQAALDNAMKQTNQYYTSILSPQALAENEARRAGILSGAQNPTLLGPAATALGIVNQGNMTNLQRQLLQQQINANRPPSALESSLGFLGSLAGGINWGGLGGNSGGGGGSTGGSNDLGGLFDFLNTPGLPPGTPPPYGTGDDQWL